MLCLHLWHHLCMVSLVPQLSCFFLLFVSFLFYLSPPSSLHRCAAKPELGGRRTEKKQTENEKKKEREREGDRISIPHWITGVESKTTECAGTGQKGWIQ